MSVRALRVALLWALLVSCASAAQAQIYIRPGGPRAGATELTLGGSWTGGQDGGTVVANLTGNTGEPANVQLFRSESSLRPVFGGNVALAVYLSRSLAVEAGFHYSRPQVRSRLTSDFEDAPSVTATTTLAQYLFTGSLVYHFATTGRLTPFVAGGAGHIRDAYDGNNLIETGTEYHGLTGVKMRVGRRGKAGFRFDVGVSVRDGGFTLKDGRRTAPVASAAFIYMF